MNLHVPEILFALLLLSRDFARFWCAGVRLGQNFRDKAVKFDTRHCTAHSRTGTVLALVYLVPLVAVARLAHSCQSLLSLVSPLSLSGPFPEARAFMANAARTRPSEPLSASEFRRGRATFRYLCAQVSALTWSRRCAPHTTGRSSLRRAHRSLMGPRRRRSLARRGHGRPCASLAGVGAAPPDPPAGRWR